MTRLLCILPLVLILPARALDPRVSLPQLVERVVIRDDANQTMLKSLQYHEKLVVEQIGENDTISGKQESELIIRPGGTPEVQVLSTHGDDLPSDPDEAAAKAKGQEEQRKRTNISLRELAGRFDLQLLGQTDFHGEPAYLIGFEPKPNQPYQNQTERVLNHLHGTMLIRARDAVVLKTEASLAEPTEIAWILASINRLDFHYELLSDINGVGPCRIETFVEVKAPFITFRQRMLVDLSQFEPRTAVTSPQSIQH